MTAEIYDPRPHVDDDAGPRSLSSTGCSVAVRGHSASRAVQYCEGRLYRDDVTDEERVAGVQQVTVRDGEHRPVVAEPPRYGLADGGEPDSRSAWTVGQGYSSGNPPGGVTWQRG